MLRNAFAEVATEDTLALLTDPATPVSQAVTGIVVDTVLVAVAANKIMRLRKFHLHADPALSASVYPVVTLKLGAVTVFSDKFEAGLPYAEALPVEGVAGADLTISIDAAATIYVNAKYTLETA